MQKQIHPWVHGSKPNLFSIDEITKNKSITNIMQTQAKNKLTINRLTVCVKTIKKKNDKIKNK